jgi:hypothetical protein
MKWLIVVGGLLLASAIPAKAQTIGFGGGSIGRVTFPSMTHFPETQFNSVVVSGSDQDFVPTTFVSFDKGIAEGCTTLGMRPKSLGEIAHEYSVQARLKAKVAFVQNNDGDAIITRVN